MKKTAFLPSILSLALLALPAAANDGHAVYRPGLTQARIPLYSPMGYLTPYLGIPAFASNLRDNAERDWIDRTLGVFKDNVDGDGAGAAHDDDVNPISGKTWPWILEEQHGVFAYEGELWVEEGTNYYFFGRCADGEAMVVDGDTVVWQGLVSAYNLTANVRTLWTAPKTGWVPFNVWFWSFEGHTGKQQGCEWGVLYNTANLVVEGTESQCRKIPKNSYSNVWHRFVDPGNGTFLRTATDERFTTVGESVAVEGGRSFDLTFAGVPTNATLVAFSGVFDGFHGTSSWDSVSAVLAEIPPGNTTTNITVDLDENAKVLRFRLAHFNEDSTDGLEVFEEWTEMFAVSASPVVRLDAVAPGYTNVVVSGTLGSFGLDGSSATVTVEIAMADDTAFERPVASNVLASASAVGAFEAGIFGLATNTDYIVRATAVNDKQAPGISAVTPFRTHEPSPSAVSVAATLCKLASADLTATISDWGGGSWDAEAWIDVSADDSFPEDGTQTLPLGTLSGRPPASASATATGLHMASNYFARCRVVNSWGLETASETIPFSTGNTPIGFPETALTTPSGGGVSVTLAPTFVTEGTVYDVSLEIKVNDRVVGTNSPVSWKNRKAVEDFFYRQYTSAGNKVDFLYTIDWTNEDAGLSGRFTIPGEDAEAQLADIKFNHLPMIDPAYDDGENHGVYLRPGDKVEIRPSAGARIDWHTNAVLSVTPTNGVYLVEALEPGATLLYETGADGNPNGVTGAAIVLPSENPPGGIYVHRTLPVLPEFSWSWNDPGEWEIVAPGAGAYPNGAGAMVYIVSDALGVEEGQRNIEIVEPVTIGWLAVGQLGWIHHKQASKSHWPWIFSDNKGIGGSIRFDTGDGSASWLRLLGHSYVTSRVLFEVPVSMANDLDVDELDRIQDTDGWQNTRHRGLWFMRPFNIGANVFRTIRAHPYPYNFAKGASGVESAGWVSFRNNVLGSGTIRLEAATHTGLIGMDSHGHVASFSGTWDVANGDLDPRINYRYGGAALNSWGMSLGNAREMIIRGSWHRAEKTWPRGALVRTGFNEVREGYDTGNGYPSWAWTNDWQDALPSKITLDGGDLQIQPQGPMNSAAQAAANATGIRRNLFRIGELVIPAGPMGRMDFRNRNNSTRFAHARTAITNLVLAVDSVVSFDLDGNLSNVSNELYFVNRPETAWTPDENAESQFLPFFFANSEMDATGGNTPDAASTSIQDNTRLAFRDAGTGKVSLEAPSTTGNGYRRWTAGEELIDGASYYAMLLASGVTNAFAPGAMVQNLAGYLDMRKGAALGVPGEDAGATLDFGDQPARIFNGNWGEVGTIGCKLAGSAGLVTGGNGTIVLAASAEGVSGGVRVAGGTLQVGAVDGEGKPVRGRIGGDVRVEAGSRLVLRDTGSIAPKSKLFLNDRDWIPSVGHVRLEAGAKAIVKEIFVDGEALPHGWYGSSESDAQFVDDVHFEGPGMIHAGNFPTMMILR